MVARADSGSETGLTRTKEIAGFAIKEFVQPPYRRLPWHEHREASICFVVSGSYTERLAGVDTECAPRSMVFKPAVERHADQFGSQGGKCLLVEIAPGRLRAIEPASSVTRQPTLVRSARLGALGQRLYGEFADADAVTPLAVEGLVLEILAEASRACSDGPRGRPPAWLRRTRELLYENFSEPLTLSSVAHAVGVHPSHLARTFRAHYRRSIGAYIRHLRVEGASRELAETETPLAQIALRAGFFDQSHFSRVFKARTGMTPTQFRAASQERTSHPTRRPPC